MKSILNFKLVSTILFSILLAACVKSGGDEFIGKWVNVKTNKSALQIVKNGDSFLVKTTSTMTGSALNFPATYKDGVLQAGSGFGFVNLTIDKSSGHLFDGHAEYVRDDASEGKK